MALSKVDLSSIGTGFQELSVSTDAILDSRINFIQNWMLDHMLKFTFNAPRISGRGSSFWRLHKCSPKHGVNSILQLACYRHYDR